MAFSVYLQLVVTTCHYASELQLVKFCGSQSRSVGMESNEK